MRKTYEVRYVRTDGTFGAYCGSDVNAYIKEISDCERLGYEYTATIKVGDVEGKFPVYGKTLEIETPIGKFVAETSGSKESYPGINVSIIKNDACHKELIACTEYYADANEIHTECYMDGCDAPSSIIRNNDGVDILQ